MTSLPHSVLSDTDPQHARAVAGPTSAVHLLLIAHDFPPTNSSAALRALALVERLAAHGGRATVVSLRGGARPATDAALAARIPAGCAVRRAAGFDSKAALSLRGRYPWFVAFPDRHVSWLPPALRSALAAHRQRPADVVLSTSPPVTAHAIGALFHRLTGVPWIAELRDAWNLGAPAGRVVERANRQLARAVYRRAARLVVTTDGLAQALRAGDPQLAAKICVVTNGFDEADFAGRPALEAAPGPFTIVHAGSCTPPYRDPRPFLAALCRAVEAGELPPDLRVSFVGAGSELRQAIDATRRGARAAVRIDIGARVTHAQAIAAMHEAALLLLLQDNPEHRTSVPQKLYEYLRSGRPILVIAPADSESAALARASAAAAVHWAAPDDARGMVRVVHGVVQAWRAAPQQRFERDVAAFERRVLADRMLEVIEQARRLRDGDPR